MANSKQEVKMDKRLPAMVLQHLAKKEKNLAWLAKTAGINYDDLYKVIAEKEGVLSEEMILGINNVLGSNFKLMTTRQEPAEKDVRDDILAWLKENKRSLNWLCTETKLGYSGMYNCFIQRVTKLTDERLGIINKTLKTKFKQRISSNGRV